jgi:hypothetical protein
MGEMEDFLTALNVALVARGVKLEFVDGELWASARGAAEQAAFEADYGVVITGLRAILRGESTPAEKEPELKPEPSSDDDGGDKPQPAAPLESWMRMGDGAEAFMARLTGEAPVPSVPVAQATVRITTRPLPAFLTPDEAAARSRADRATYLRDDVPPTPTKQLW